jgi:GAF domain-containing protein
MFYAECELISYNNSSNCLACGSSALLNLSRVLGGPIQQHERARIVEDDLIQRVVSNILEFSRPIRDSSSTALVHSPEAPQMRKQPTAELASRTLPDSLPQLQPAMGWVVERAWTLTRAEGAALALKRQGKLICHAQAGTSAPDLGTEVDPGRGISGLCARTGTAWRCDDASSDPYVDRGRCRELGSASVVAAPLTHLNSVLGVLEVFSPDKNAFSDHDVATAQLLAGLMMVAITRNGQV